MQIKNSVIVRDDKEIKIYKLSEQGVMSFIMVVQKVFADIAQNKEDVSIEELLEGYEFIIDSNDKLWVTNPVTVTINKTNPESDEDDDEDMN